MADRGLLHENQLEPFIAFVETQGYRPIAAKGIYERLRLYHPEKPLVLFFQRTHSDHLTTQTGSVGYSLVTAFLRSKAISTLSDDDADEPSHSD